MATCPATATDTSNRCDCNVNFVTMTQQPKPDSFMWSAAINSAGTSISSFVTHRKSWSVFSRIVFYGNKPRMKNAADVLSLFFIYALIGLCAAAAAGNSHRKVRITVIAPEKANQDEETLGAILPAVDLAVKAIANPVHGRLAGYEIEYRYRNSNCSATYGPLAAIELHNMSDVFLGPVCDYVIAPVARYSGAWNIPVITSGAQVDVFSFKPDFPTLTRMMGSYRLVGEALRYILNQFNWNVAGIIYFNHALDSPLGHAKCHFTMSAVYKALNQKPFHHSFNESADSNEYKRLLQEVAKTARIVVVCAKVAMVREILLAAEELNMIDSGEFVFFSIELYSSLDHSSLTPWYVKNDTEERNARARKAYSALLIVTARTPNNQQYRNFSMDVKKLALNKYKYSFGNESVTPHITAFYDAVLLYALALNETLEQGGLQSNGLEISKRMWNRTFEGITGNVYIDEKGDRIADYSLLDMNPETNEFRIVAHYIGVNQSLEYLPRVKIHWAGDRTEPPPDTPPCGFDNSLCAQSTSSIYAALSIVLSSVVVVLSIVSFFIFREIS